ncbi:DnaD domain protein [Lactobacillus sp. ESL0225]|uniref:DnaD domain protein n=1 Tax=Lactobacillus sp. ESL0225 TaxID=2069351 RepID=UPI000EFD8872|nr:DnaD domain protein [Lactobacillus sp. ESL0225]RMC49443.1 chromosome replication initiation protein [Lactobacillus sp. ESL0225]
MFMTPNPKQPFLIINRVEISITALRILVKLYQPLIGSLALALYLSLNEDYRPQMILSDAHGLYSLQEQLDCDLKSLFIALHKLEAVGLVQTKLLDNKIMGQVLTFRLAEVPSSSEFFATTLLASLLKEKVGVTVFQKLSSDFAHENKQNKNTVTGLANAQDISASFMDVFSLPKAEAIDPSPEVKQAVRENQVGQNQQASINQQDSIDWDFMKQQFEIYQIPNSEIDKNREAIRGLMRTYGLAEQEFVDETLSCLHGEYQLNMPLIKRTIANTIHGTDTQQQNQKRTLQANSTFNDKQFSKKEQEILQLAHEKTPAQFIYYLKNESHDFVDASEYQLLDNLYNQKGISADLLNILTYVCLQSSPKLSYNLTNTILHDWLQHGVHSGEQALEYIAKRKQTKQKNKVNHYRNYSKKSIEKGTDWSKRQAKNETDVSADDLKNFFKNFESENGMK